MLSPQLGEPLRGTVLLVIGSLGGGGAERQMSDMANCWATRGRNVVVATWSGPEVADFYSLDARIVRKSLDIEASVTASSSRILLNGRRIARLRRLIASLHPDVVLSFMTESNLLTILAGAGLGVRVVVSERVQPALHKALPLTWRILRRVCYMSADAVVAQTREAALWLKKNCLAVVTVIPNALRDLPTLSGERSKLIVAVGRLTHQKGFDVLLRAFARIASEFADWRVAIIGEGEERQALTRLRGDLLLDQRVDFIGQTRDVVSWMARAGLVVQPSRFEGFPNVVLESMALGAAVICTDCHSGPADLIKDGVNGRLVPVDDVSGLAGAIAELISSSDKRVQFGRAATEVRERYRQDLVMDQWEKCLFPEIAKTRLPRPNYKNESK